MEKTYISVQECLEDLRKELVNPVRFVAKGFYRFHQKENPFSGVFDIDTNNKILGYMDYDSNSICSTSMIDGKIKFENDGIVMDFLKRYTNLRLLNVLYHLKKFGEPKELVGEYKGNWFVKEKGLAVDKVQRYLRGEIWDVTEFTEDLFDPEQGNDATLRLSKL